MGTFTDDDLRHLLGEAGASFAVPEDGPVLVLDALEQRGRAVPLRRRRLVRLTSAAAVAVIALVVGVGLSGGDEVDRVGQLAGAPSSGAEALARPPAAAPGVVYGPMRSSAKVTSGRALSGAAADRLVPLSDGKAAQPAATAPVDGARVVKKGTVALLVDDGQVTPTLTRVQGYAKAAGGLVAGAQTEEAGATPSGSVTLRVPVDRFEQLVTQVRGAGAQVRSATTSGTDVTAQYADLEAQLRTLTAARERFLTILSRAGSIGDVLAVQSRVDDVTGRIDRLEGQRRVLAAQTDSATLEVTVTEQDDPAVAPPAPDSGLSKAFSDAGAGFTTGVEALVRLSGRGLLLLLLAVGGWAALRTGWRLSRRRLV